MRCFVASWFFPPATSSEGIVAYKLLRRSSHEYDVCSSSSDMWGYQAKIDAKADNIRVFSFNVTSIDEWVDASTELFEKLHSEKPYDFIMTRSMPPESIRVGLCIKKKHPEIKWIASMGDPVANNPYELNSNVKDATDLTEIQKKTLLEDLVSGKLTAWDSERNSAGIRLLIRLKRLEDAAFQQADLLICPSEAQRKYMLRGRTDENKIVAIPHTFEKDMYPNAELGKDEQIVLTYLGSTDERRSLKPLIRALKWIREQSMHCDRLIPNQPDYSVVLDKLLFRFVGNHPRSLKDMVIDYYLDEQVEFVSDVDYLTSLKMMRESDWLIHVDAYFPELQPGGSIFFAGKLADYLGSERPILGFTGRGSPADYLVQGCGGLCIYEQEPEAIANCLLKIANGFNCTVDTPDREAYRNRFAAEVVAGEFDRMIDQRFCSALPLENMPKSRKKWHVAKESSDKKLVTICVPSYNVQQFLDRCLQTLVCCRYSPLLDIIVVNDGSKDYTSKVGHEYERRYPGIITVVDKENGGHGSTINCALERARGTYFMVVDADDWINTDAFEKLLEPMISGEIDADLISANYDLIDIESAEMTVWMQECEPEYGRVYRFDELDTKKSYFTLASSLFKTEILRKHGQKLQEHTFFVDVEYILFPIPYVDTVLFSDLKIYRYCRGNTEQSVHTPNMVKRFDQHDRVMRRVLTYYHETKMSVAHKAYMKEILCKLLYTHYALMLVHDWDMARGVQRCKEFDAYLGKLEPELAERMRSTMPYLKMVRAANFDLAEYQKKLNGSMNRFREKSKPFVKKILRRLLHTKIARKFLNSGFAAKLKRSKLGRSSLAQKIKSMCM